MDISVSRARGVVSVAIIKLVGHLDGQNYQDLITKARELFGEGARDFLLDLSDLTYISSAGLVALHSLALLTRGEELPDTRAGWAAYRSMGRASEAGIQRHVKLLNPRAQVTSVLDMVGFGNLFEIFTDLDKAVDSFA
jgi:anti-anti-sigma regulatory factor